MTAAGCQYSRVTDGIGERLLDAVGEAMRDVAAIAIMPRFRASTYEEVTFEGTDDVVTTVSMSRPRRS